MDKVSQLKGHLVHLVQTHKLDQMLNVDH